MSRAAQCVVIFGPPGGGKSTLSRELLRSSGRTTWFGVRHYFAAQMDRGTELGRRAEPYARARRWLPDELVADALGEHLDDEPDADVHLLEGVPARRSQVEVLRGCLTRRRLPPPVVLHVDTPLSTCLQRARERLVCDHCDWGSAPADLRRIGDAVVCNRCGEPVTRRWNDSDEEFCRRLQTYRREAPDTVRAFVTGPEHLVWLDGLEHPDAIVDRARQVVRNGGERR